MNKVWVIMGNDFPSGVASSEEKANEMIERFKEQWAKRSTAAGRPLRIYWRSYEFEIDAEVGTE